MSTSGRPTATATTEPQSGRIVTQWPFSMDEFRNRTAAIDPDAFEVGVR